MPSNPPYDDDWSGESRYLQTGAARFPKPASPVSDPAQAIEPRVELSREEKIARQKQVVEESREFWDGEIAFVDSRKEIRPNYDKDKRCCTVCDAKKLCSVCREQADTACSDCRIDFGVSIYVCGRRDCRASHKAKCSSCLREKLDLLSQPRGEQPCGDKLEAHGYLHICKHQKGHKGDHQDDASGTTWGRREPVGEEQGGDVKLPALGRSRTYWSSDLSQTELDAVLKMECASPVWWLFQEREEQLLEALRTIAALKSKPLRKECVDCRDYQANIRGWIEQLGGNVEVTHISAELERLIDAIAKPLSDF